jgi:carboxyl-terminal processing protease
MFLIIVLSLLLSKDKKEIKFNNNENYEDYIELFESSFNKLKVNFVDSVNESEMIKAGIKGMMKNLDPYTKLLEDNSLESFDILRKGKYGGVGIQIGLRRDTLTVLSPMEDSPAYSEGIIAGDKIMKVDSTFTKGLNVSDASNLIKGEVGSSVILGIYRPSTKEEIDFELTRSNIVVKHVPYWGVDKNNVGYIRITRFSRNASKDFKKGLEELQKQDINGLVIDLRGNSGGLLSNAINILDYLCERGELLLYSKGKTNRSNKEWKSRRKPILDIDTPIVVLVSKGSASASEIVAGTLQDLDRAVIIGQNTFGKGLVQHMYDLNDTITLKITTSKYYLPSGRLIQKQDYLNNGFLTDGLDKRDSLFTTKGGRLVEGGNGIVPDIRTTRNVLSPYVQELWRQGVFLSFAASYVPFNKQLEVPINIDSKIMKDFKLFIKDYNIDYKLKGEDEYLKFLEKMKKSPISINQYSKNIYFKETGSEDFINTDVISNYFEEIKKVQFSLDENQRWIKNGLERELSKVLVGEKGRIRASLNEDREYEKAVELILDLKEYYIILDF